MATCAAMVSSLAALHENVEPQCTVMYPTVLPIKLRVILPAGLAGFVLIEYH